MQRLCIKLSGCYEIFTQRSNRFPSCWKLLKLTEKGVFSGVFFTGRHKPTSRSLPSDWKVRGKMFLLSKERETTEGEPWMKETQCVVVNVVVFWCTHFKKKKKKNSECLSVLSLSLFMFVWHSCLAHEMFCCRRHLLFLKGWCDVRAGAVTSPVLHHLSPDANTVCCLKCVGTAFPKKKTPLNEGVTTSFITNQPIVYWCWIRVEQL